jgi:N-acetylglucosaminyldiphosphoundecaprenol N-acetyl-beta-D-mannosaminyltransferase
MSLDDLPTFELLGAPVTPMRVEDLLMVLRQAVESESPWVIGNHNLHSLYLYHRDPEMRAFYALARCTFVDGMSLVLAGRLLGVPLGRDQRLAGVDWLHPVLRQCRSLGWRVFLLGSRPGVAERAAAILTSKLPGLELETAHGYFDSTPGSGESEAVVARLQEYRPQVLIVCMGMPRQERWIAAHVSRLAPCAVLNQGALLDYVAGEVPTPPRLAGRLGLEWLSRLVAEPARLWRRYLVEPWSLLPVFLREYARHVRAGSTVRRERGRAHR